MQFDVLTFLTSGNMSSIIAALEPIYQLCKRDNKKAVIYIDTTGDLTCNSNRLNQLIKSEIHGKRNKMDNQKFEFLRTLIKYQPYIEDVIEWDESITLNKIDYNLNEIAYITDNPEYYAYYKSDFENNLMYLSQIICGLKPKWNGPWLEIPSSFKTLKEFEEEKIRLEAEKLEQERLTQQKKVPDFIQNQNKEQIPQQDQEPELEPDISGKKTLICRSVRGQSADSFFHSHAEMINQKALFIGYDYEYEAFCQAYDIEPERRKISDALQGAEIINRMKRFIVNDSLFFWIALGIGKKEIIHEITVDGSRHTKFIDCPNIKYLIGSKFETFTNQQKDNLGHKPAIVNPPINPPAPIDPTIPRFKTKEYQQQFNIIDQNTWPERYKNQNITAV